MSLEGWQAIRPGLQHHYRRILTQDSLFVRRSVLPSFLRQPHLLRQKVRKFAHCFTTAYPSNGGHFITFTRYCKMRVKLTDWPAHAIRSGGGKP